MSETKSSMSLAKQIYSMNLLDITQTDSGLTIIRVPGGWLFERHVG
ncbi:hypothetical protein LCGC14_2441930, partial [marine sediment metagenome]